jgi:hypothetical protein
MTIRVAACGLLSLYACLFTACSVPSPDATNAAPQNPQNYAPDAQFMQHHGKFMLKREPWRPEASVSGLYTDGAGVKGEPGTFDMTHVKADIVRRVNLADYDMFVNFGFRYENRHYSFSPAAQGAPGGTGQVAANVDLNRASALIQYGHFLTQDTLLEVDFTPGVWTDFSGTLHGDDWQFYGKGLMTWRYDEQLFLMVGGEYSGLFRSVDVYPMIGTAWIPDPQWRVDVLLPRRVRLTHIPDDYNSIYLSVDLDGGNYEVSAPTPGQRSRRISAQEFAVSLGGEHRVDAHLSVFGRVGTTIGGHYEFRANGAGAYDGTLEPQVFAEIGLGWSF